MIVTTVLKVTWIELNACKICKIFIYSVLESISNTTRVVNLRAGACFGCWLLGTGPCGFCSMVTCSQRQAVIPQAPHRWTCQYTLNRFYLRALRPSSHRRIYRYEEDLHYMLINNHSFEETCLSNANANCNIFSVLFCTFLCFPSAVFLAVIMHII